MQKIGCFGWVAILIGLSLVLTWLQKLGTAGTTLVVVVLAAAILGAFLLIRNSQSKNHSSELLEVAEKIDRWASGNLFNGTAETEGDEEALFDITQVELLEFKSTGSSYSGAHAGISFPLFGRIRGNVGGSQGQITRNPEELTSVDTGTLKITSKRIIFIGEKEARVFELAKVLDFELGPNGLWLKIAMNNKAKREGFQHMALDQIPIGIAVGIANAWSNDGKEAAITYAKNVAEQIRTTMAAEAASKSKN
jgi:hypothetical protein